MRVSTIPIFLLAFILSGSSLRAQVAESQADLTLRAKALNNQGVKRADAGKYAEAIELFREAITLRPDNAVAYGNLGVTLYRAGQLEEAVAALQKALQLNPAFAEAFSKLGAVYSDLGHDNEAVEFLRQAIKLQPNSINGTPQFGLRIRQQKFKEAAAALERAAQLDPKFSETFVQLGYALSRLKKYGAAITQLEQAVRLQPHYAEVQFFLGQLHLADRDKQAALAQYRKIALLDSQLARKLFAVIYSNLLVAADEKR